MNGKCNSKVNKFIHFIFDAKKFPTKIHNFSIFYFTEKYEYVGRLLRPGEKPTSYSDEEDESESSKAGNKSEDITNVNATDVSSTTSDKPKNEWPKSWWNSNANNNNNDNNNKITLIPIHPNKIHSIKFRKILVEQTAQKEINSNSQGKLKKNH